MTNDPRLSSCPRGCGRVVAVAGDSLACHCGAVVLGLDMTRRNFFWSVIAPIAVATQLEPRVMVTDKIWKLHIDRPDSIRGTAYDGDGRPVQWWDAHNERWIDIDRRGKTHERTICVGWNANS